jgi:3-deoxy-manno-octulosonate cytidylyltransferase (CMP-KDO synthetase)
MSWAIWVTGVPGSGKSALARAAARRAEAAVVATDDRRILEAVERFGGQAVMTSPTARSGTERAAELFYL